MAASRSYAFLRTGRWIGVLMLALAVACTCVLLGRWQYHRYEHKAEQAELVSANYDADPLPAADLLESFDPADEWRPVTLSGEYVGEPVRLPQRGVAGTAGDHVLAVLRAEGAAPGGGAALVVVDRGWYPGGASTDLTAQLPYPRGKVQVVARLRPAEQDSGRGSRPGEAFAISPAQVAGAAGVEELGQLEQAAYGMLATEEPTAGGLEAFPKPEADLGNHLSYTLQWCTFAAGALAGFVYLARREAAGESAAAAGSGRPRRASDGDVEDALIDAQLDATQPREDPQARDTSSA